jgi:hypothetical protein
MDGVMRIVRGLLVRAMFAERYTELLSECAAS